MPIQQYKVNKRGFCCDIIFDCHADCSQTLELTNFKVDYCMNKEINLGSLINNSKKECNCRCCNDKTGQFHAAHKVQL